LEDRNSFPHPLPECTALSPAHLPLFVFALFQEIMAKFVVFVTPASPSLGGLLRRVCLLFDLLDYHGFVVS
jgi:hypothetical protein